MEINNVLAEPKIREQLLERAAMDVVGGTTAQFAAQIARDRDLFAMLVKTAGFKPE